MYRCIYSTSQQTVECDDCGRCDRMFNKLRDRDGAPDELALHLAAAECGSDNNHDARA